MARTCDKSPAKFLRASSVLLSAAPFTFLSRFRTTDGTENFQEMGILSQAGTNNFWKMRLRIVSGKVQWQCEQTMPGKSANAEVFVVPAVGAWAAVVGISASNIDHRLFVDSNANKATSTSDVVPKSIDTTEVGQLDDGSPTEFIGDLGWAALYNIALNDHDVGILLDGGMSPLRVHRDDLVGLWPLNGRDPEYNVMGTGVDLTLFGAPPVAEEPPIHHPIIAPA